MSYCRWSSDDWQCDVYVWEDCGGGWRTEVAGRRREWRVDLPPEVTMPVGDANSPERTAWATATVERHYAVMKLLDDEANFETIDLATPLAGTTSFWHDTPGEAADNLEQLRNEGFNVPQYAIDGLRRDHEDVA